MSDKIVRHSSRYEGPAGDCRAPKEIFASIARKEKEREYLRGMLNALFDGIFYSRELEMSIDGRIDLIRAAVVDWLYKLNEIDSVPDGGEK